MSERDFLLLKPPSIGKRSRPPSGPSSYHFPTIGRQVERLTGQFAELYRSFRSRRMELQASPTGAVPEQVLIFETVGSIEEFIKAVRNIRGMEWLGEADLEEIESDEDFNRGSASKSAALSGRIYMVMTSQQAMREMLSLWNKFKRNPTNPFIRGLNKWRNVFRQLRTIRPWDLQERIHSTGVLPHWTSLIEQGNKKIVTEVELWFRHDLKSRKDSLEIVRNLISKVRGSVVREVSVPEIAYHAVLADLPAQAVSAILSSPGTALVKCDQIMYFKKTGQCMESTHLLEGPEHSRAESSLPSGPPRIALLDGMPLEGHQLLQGRLRVDDPDQLARVSPAHSRHHGTGMASVLIHGDLGHAGGPLLQPIYVRPILVPVTGLPGSRIVERIPEDELPVDLINRAVDRMFVPSGAGEAVAPTVKLVNLSVCDSGQPFGRMISPWARMVDWLSWKYHILFLLSGGNHPLDLELSGIPRGSLASVPAQQLQAATLRAMASQSSQRRILAPSESINALCVAASQDDGGANAWAGPRHDPIANPMAPSPINPVGLGYRRSVKPDILLQGGRQLYSESPLGRNGNLCLEAVPSSLPPGIQCASPSGTPGQLSSTRHSCGTSNATAMATRLGSRILDVIEGLLGDSGSTSMTERYAAVLTKALLVHGAEWGTGAQAVASAIRSGHGSPISPDQVSRFLGYGRVSESRCLGSTDHRVTLLGFGTIREDEGHIFNVPLPPALSGTSVHRRLVVSLAWLTPINVHHRDYRLGALWYEIERDPLQTRRTSVHWQTAKRGTVQHEIFEGNRSVVFSSGTELRIKVNRRGEAGGSREAIPYGLAVTLEAAPQIGVSIYDQVRARIQPTVVVRP